MLKICTVYFEGFYTPDYVTKLYKSLKQNSTIPFEFVCISDTNDIEADVILPYNHNSDINDKSNRQSAAYGYHWNGIVQAKGCLVSRGRGLSKCRCGQLVAAWHRMWRCAENEGLLGALPRRLVEQARSHPESLLITRGWAARPQFPVPLDEDFLFGGREPP